MHNSAGVSYPVSFGISVSGLQVTNTPSVSCGGPCPTFTYDWNWGEVPNTSTNPASTRTAPRIEIDHLDRVPAIERQEGGLRDAQRHARQSGHASGRGGHVHADTNAWTMTIVGQLLDDGPDADTLPPDGNATLKITMKWGATPR